MSELLSDVGKKILRELVDRQNEPLINLILKIQKNNSLVTKL